MKMRLDDYLVAQRLVATKSKAKQHIVDRHEVMVNQVVITKAGYLINPTIDRISFQLRQPAYVSRGGLKLKRGLEMFNCDLTNKVCLDIGASTGGFTQVCLAAHAQLVYAVDVGVNQLASSLQNDARVVEMSGVNFRYVHPEMFTQAIDFFCCDVSFISLAKILPPLSTLIADQVTGIVLLKPQFEIAHIHKSSIIFNQHDHVKIIQAFIEHAKQAGFSVIDITYSPILGNKKHNIEFLVYLQKTTSTVKIWQDDIIIKIVKNTWASLT